MSKYHLIYLTWLIPGFLLFLMVHQILVYGGIINTYENGSSYTAEVLEFEVKQIAAQTNGYIVLTFTTDRGNKITQKLSLPIEMAGKLQELQIIPIRYQQDAFQNIVLIPAYDTQKGLVLTNIAMAGLGLLITLFVAWAAHRYARRKLSEGEQEFIIERVD